jgi:hypothetical protein
MTAASGSPERLGGCTNQLARSMPKPGKTPLSPSCNRCSRPSCSRHHHYAITAIPMGSAGRHVQGPPGAHRGLARFHPASSGDRGAKEASVVRLHPGKPDLEKRYGLEIGGSAIRPVGFQPYDRRSGGADGRGSAGDGPIRDMAGFHARMRRRCEERCRLKRSRPGRHHRRSGITAMGCSPHHIRSARGGPPTAQAACDAPSMIAGDRGGGSPPAAICA